MTPNERLELRLAYEAACDNYLAAFLEKYELTCDPEPWVANEAGTIAMIGDWFFDFQDIKRSIDEDVTFHTLMEWYDYNLDARELGLNEICLKAWLMGAPRAMKEDIDNIKARRKELEELIKNQNEKNGGLK